MKKFLVGLLCFTFIMSSFASFAEEVQVTPTVDQSTSSEKLPMDYAISVPSGLASTAVATQIDQIVQATVYEEQVSEEDVEALIKLDELEALEAEQNSVISSVYDVSEINAQNAVMVLTSINKYLTIRDKYYRSVLLKIKGISQTKNSALARKAIVKFEERFKKQIEIDRKIHHKIEKVLKYINSHKNKLDKNQKAVIRIQLKPVMQKYFKHRQLIIHIQNTIKKVKVALFKQQVMKLRQLAWQFEKAKKFDAALKVYEEILKDDDADKELYKKIGQINKNLGKKAPGIYVGKQRVQANIEPVIKNGTTLVPLRAVSEALDADVKWDGKTKTITITKGDKVIQLTLKSKVIKVNGESKTISQPADVIFGNTVVPLRVVSETLDAKVGWDPNASIITVDDNLTSSEGTIDTNEAAISGIITNAEIDQKLTEEQIENQVLSEEYEEKMDEDSEEAKDEENEGKGNENGNGRWNR